MVDEPSAQFLLLLGAAQVLLTTAAVGAIAWLAGVPTAAAFVVGAVFAESSSTIIGRQLHGVRDRGYDLVRDDPLRDPKASGEAG